MRTHERLNYNEPSSGQVGVSSVDDWFTPTRFAFALALLLFALFPEVFLGKATFFARDFGLFGYPLAHYHREAFWRGEIPLWNPLNNCGLPFLAQWNTMVLYPPSLFYLVLPLSWSLGMFCLGHLFLGGMGMYYLAHRWTGNRLAAALAGVAFAFSGFAWQCLGWPNNIAALGWMPWLALAAERAWREGGHSILVAALVGTLQMLTGAPEILALSWALLGGLLCTELLLGFLRRTPGTWRLPVRLGVVAVLATGLAAAQLLPFLELLKHSQRGVGYVSSGGWSMPGTGWANFLVPLFECGRAHFGIYMQHDQQWTTSYYVGIGVFALAIVASWRVRQPRVWCLALMLGLSLILALGDNGYLFGWLRQAVPQLGFMRFPVKFVVLAVFIIPLLAAYAVAWHRHLPQAERREHWRSVPGVGLVLLAVMLGVVWFAHAYPLRLDDWPATWRNALARAAFLGGVIVLFVALQRVSRFRTQAALACALALLLVLDVRTSAPDLQPTVARSVFTPGLIREHGQFDPLLRHGQSRAMLSAAALRRMTYTSVTRLSEDMLGRRVSLQANCNLLDDIPKLNGFYSLYLKEADHILRWMEKNPIPDPLLDFLNVSHVSETNGNLRWNTRPAFLPLATAGQKPVFADPAATLKALTNSTIDYRNLVYLPPEARSLILATNGTPARILSSRFDAHAVVLEAEAKETAMVVVAQGHYPAWKAYVDGTPTHLWRANYAFQALSMPPGQHRIELRYEDRAFHLGTAISLATLLTWVLAWFGIRRSASTPPAPEPGQVGQGQCRFNPSTL